MLDDYQDLIDELLGTPALVRTLFTTPRSALAGTQPRYRAA